jgi:hypothetical protein
LLTEDVELMSLEEEQNIARKAFDLLLRYEKRVYPIIIDLTMESVWCEGWVTARKELYNRPGDDFDSNAAEEVEREFWEYLWRPSKQED